MSDLPLIILGSGGHAKSVIEALMLSNKSIVGIVSEERFFKGKFMGLDLLGDDNAVFKYNPSDVHLVNGLGSLPDNHRRWDLCKDFRRHGYHFAHVIHPASIVSSDVIIESGVQIMAGVTIQPGCRIGQDTIVNTAVVIDHDCEIGSACHLAPGVTLSGSVRIGDNVHIGTGVISMQNISIGSNSVVGAGCVLYKSIPNNVRVKNRLVLDSKKI